MKRLLAFVAGTSVLLGAYGAAFASVSGSVVDVNGKPIPKAKVAVLRYDSRVGKALPEIVYSDQQGRFFSKCDGNIQVTAAGYSVWGGYASPGRDTKVCLIPETVQKGRVLDNSGKPVSGAAVGIEACYISSGDGKIQSNYHSEQGFSVAPDAVTASDGSFVLRHLPSALAGSYISLTLKVTKPDRAKITRYVQQNEIGNNLRIVQPLECILTGHVANGDGSSVSPGSSLCVSVRSVGMSEVRSTAVKTGGSFEFHELPPGDARIWMISPQSPNKHSDWVLPVKSGTKLVPSKTMNLNLQTVKASQIEGCIIDKSTGKPTGRANYRVLDDSRATDMWTVECTDDQGHFSVSVAPGDVSICVQSFVHENRYVNFSNDDMPKVDFTVASGESKQGVRVEIDEKESVYDLYQRVEETKTDPELCLAPGTYTLSWDDSLDLSRALYPQRVHSTDELKGRIKGLDKLVSKKPNLVSYQFDGNGYDGALVVVCDESKGTGTGYDTAYIDTNRNWDISDDKPIKWKADTGMGGGIRTKAAEVKTHQGDLNGEHLEHPVNVSLTVYSYGNVFQAMPMIRGGWTGSIQSNKGPIQIVPLDSNRNGRYDDIYKDAKGQRDSFAVDTNNVGKVLLWAGCRHVMCANEVVSIANKLYNLSVNSIGEKVTVKPYTGASGQAAVGVSMIGGLDAKLVGMTLSDGKSSYTLYDCSANVLLPVGLYSVESCNMLISSSKLSKPRISVAASETVKIESDKTSTLSIGGDITGAIDKDAKETVFHPGEQGQFTWSLDIGRNASITSLGDVDRSRSVKIKLIDASGKIVYSGGAGYT